MNQDIIALVSDLVPGDSIEAAQRAETLAWLARTDDIFRRVKPRTPPKHLVAYVLPLDPSGAVLLGAHRLSGLWLPPGGHVEPGERPADTARRECLEELGVTLPMSPVLQPHFLSVSETVADADPHTDVSLWFPVRLSTDTAVHLDVREFSQIQWWSRAALAEADSTRFDPQLGRCLQKDLSMRAER